MTPMKMKFKKLAMSKTPRVDPELHEEALTGLRIVHQALDALQEANNRFAADFEAWRKDWRDKLSMLDVKNAESALIAQLNSEENSHLDTTKWPSASEHHLVNPTAGAPEQMDKVGSAHDSQLHDYVAFMRTHASRTVVYDQLEDAERPDAHPSD